MTGHGRVISGMQPGHRVNVTDNTQRQVCSHRRANPSPLKGGRPPLVPTWRSSLWTPDARAAASWCPPPGPGLLVLLPACCAAVLFRILGRQRSEGLCLVVLIPLVLCSARLPNGVSYRPSETAPLKDLLLGARAACSPRCEGKAFVPLRLYSQSPREVFCLLLLLLLLPLLVLLLVLLVMVLPGHDRLRAGRCPSTGSSRSSRRRLGGTSREEVPRAAMTRNPCRTAAQRTWR